jgi:hypothetical protein
MPPLVDSDEDSVDPPPLSRARHVARGGIGLVDPDDGEMPPLVDSSEEDMPCLVDSDSDSYFDLNLPVSGMLDVGPPPLVSSDSGSDFGPTPLSVGFGPPPLVSSDSDSDYDGMPNLMGFSSDDQPFGSYRNRIGPPPLWSSGSNSDSSDIPPLVGCDSDSSYDGMPMLVGSDKSPVGTIL